MFLESYHKAYLSGSWLGKGFLLETEPWDAQTHTKPLFLARTFHRGKLFCYLIFEIIFIVTRAQVTVTVCILWP